MTETSSLPASFSRAIDIDHLGTDPRAYAMEMAEEDAGAVAEILLVPGVKGARGEATLTRHGTLIDVRGSVAATLVRECVASLELFEEVVREEFSVTYTTEDDETPPADEREADLDAPEPLEDGELDLGAVLLEQIVLGMAAHPRKPGAALPEDPGAGATISPFSVLKSLKS